MFSELLGFICAILRSVQWLWWLYTVLSFVMIKEDTMKIKEKSSKENFWTYRNQRDKFKFPGDPIVIRKKNFFKSN